MRIAAIATAIIMVATGAAAETSNPNWWDDIIEAKPPGCSGSACSGAVPKGHGGVCPDHPGARMNYLHSALVNKNACKDSQTAGSKRVFCSIQEAICAVTPGGTISVERSDPYLENLVIDKPLTIAGTGPWGVRPQLPYRGGGDETRFPVLAPPDGGRSCVQVNIKRRATDGAAFMGFLIQAPANLTQPCVDVDAPLFVFKNNWVIGDENDDGVLVRSGLASITGNQIVNADVAIRLTGRHEPGADQSAVRDQYGPSGTDTYRYYTAAGVYPELPNVGGLDRGTYNQGAHIVSDNHIEWNNIGIQVTGETDVYAARNVIIYNWTAGIQNMNGGGAFTGNYIGQNGNGIAFVYDATINDAAWWQQSPIDASGRQSPGSGPQFNWPIRAPMIIGNAIQNNSNAGVLVLADDIDGGLTQPRDDESRKQYVTRVATTLYNHMGTVWQNCIIGNTGYAIDFRAVRRRQTEAVLAGAGSRTSFPRNSAYYNGGLSWVGEVLEKISLLYRSDVKNCSWFPTPHSSFVDPTLKPAPTDSPSLPPRVKPPTR